MVAAVLAIATLACAPGDDSTPSTDRYTLERALDLRPSADHPLSGVRQVAESRDGVVLLVDAQTAGLLVFGEDGEFRELVGSRGEGPGEFLSVFKGGFLGAAPWGVDARSRVVHVFRDEVETATPPAELPGGIAFELLPDQSLFASQTESTIDAYAFGAAGVTPVVSLDLATRMWSMTEGGSSSLTQPLSHYPLLRSWPGGVVVVRRGDFGDRGFGYSVSWYSGEGLQDEVLIPTTPVGVTDDDIDAVLDPVRASSLTGILVRTGQFASEADVVESARRQLVVPASLPPVRGGGSGLEASSVIVASDGAVWVERWSDDPVVWDVVTPAGLTAQVEVADSIRLLAAADRHVWGVSLDDLGVPTVTRYDLRSGGAPPPP